MLRDADSPPKLGGVAAPINKMPRSHLSWAQTGWSLTRSVPCERLFLLASPYRARIRSAHARPLLSKVAWQHFLEVASTPPNLGGEFFLLDSAPTSGVLNLTKNVSNTSY